MKINHKNNQYFDGKTQVNKIGTGDSFYEPKFIKSKREQMDIFNALMNEVEFKQMFNISPGNDLYPLPRLVAAQTFYDDNRGIPIYRMPGCNESNIKTKPWTKTVKEIRDRASKMLNQEFNHCVIGLFRNEKDSLAYHKDKLLDLEKDSVIISVSFGAPRPIIFKSEKNGNEQTVLLNPGSILVFGQDTNHKYKHEIPKLTNEIGPRISLSFRTVDSKIKFSDEKNEDGKNELIKIIGNGNAHQCENYPFIKSFNDVAQYTDKMMEKYNFYKNAATEDVKNIRNKLYTDLSENQLSN